MRAGDRFPGQVIERSGKPLGGLARIDKKNRRVAFANNLEQARMNRVPDRNAARRLGGWARGNLFHLAQPRHVLNWNLDAQLDLLTYGRADHRDRAVAKW